MNPSIDQHEGKKYLRTIRSAKDRATSIEVDVYAVLEAFGVTCPGRQQAIKKLLCAGTRGKGDSLADLVGAQAALARAIELEQERTVESYRQELDSYIAKWKEATPSVADMMLSEEKRTHIVSLPDELEQEKQMEPRKPDPKRSMRELAQEQSDRLEREKKDGPDVASD